MELSVVNNLASFKAQSSLGTATSKLSNSLKQLSTGQRVNSAADDPSGLAISERFRTQIRGLARASSNAMDGISMFQTAEGSMNEMHTILQRMRELAVQASNGVLTASDRQEVQREVDQLKEEVDRIANNTEFNTRKLLDGKGAALWSSSSADVTATITGKVAEGNYRLDVSQEVGANHVLKTDIMGLADGEIGAVDEGTPASLALNINALAANQSVQFDFVVDGDTISVTVTGGGAGKSQAAVVGDLVSKINGSEDNGGRIEAAAGPEAGDFIIRATSAGNAGDGYTMEITTTQANVLRDWTGAAENMFSGAAVAFASSGIPATIGHAGNTNSDVIDKVYDPVGLDAGQWDIVTVDDGLRGGAVNDSAIVMGAYQGGTSTGAITAITAVADENNYVMVEVIGAGTDDSVDLRVSWDQGKNWTTYYNYDSANDAISKDANNNITLTVSGDFAVGDKFLIGVQSDILATRDMVYLDGPASAFTNVASGTTAVMAPDYGSVQHGLLVDTGTDDATSTSGHQLTTAWMDDTGNFHFGEVKVDFGSQAFDATSAKTHNLTINGSGGIAGIDTKLEDINRFYDANGNFILGDSGKWIDIYDGMGNKASVLIEGTDTLRDVADKFAQVISQDTTTYGWAGLGMGDVKDGENSKAANYVQTANGGDEAVAGTIVIRSTRMGEEGVLTFNAEEAVLNALSLATIQDAQNSTMSVNVYNAHTNEFVASEETGDNILHSVIQGTDVKLSSTSGVTASWDNTTGKISFAAESASHYLHVVDKSMDLQIGANQGQTMTAYIGEVTAEALGVKDALVVSQETAADSISKIDAAIQRVSSERARVGAYINRMDHTLNNLAVMEENQVAAESTIRDLNMAQSVSEMTQQQILQQVGTAMLAQANQLPQSIMSLFR